MFALLIQLIAVTVLKNALVGVGLKGVASLFSLITVFDAYKAITDCKDLGVFGVQIGYEVLSHQAQGYLASMKFEDTHAIERRASGLYAVNSKLHRAPLYLGSPGQYPAFAVPVRRIPVRRIPTRRIGG